jgi:hypothetical protein
MRKGFFYVTDAVIGSLLLLTFLAVVFPSPEFVDWEKTHLQKQSQDLITSLDYVGLLGKIIVSNDHNSLGGIVSSLSGRLGYLTEVHGIPKQSIELGNLINENDVILINTSSGAWTGNGIPSSENGNYRKGSFYGVRFLFYDTIYNNQEGYDSVMFDFDNDTNYSELFEGPYEFNSIFECDKQFGIINSTCNKTYYEVGPVSDKLILYNATVSKKIEEGLDSITMPYFEVYFTVDNLNLKYEGIAEQDILIFNNVNLTELNNYSETILNFLSLGNSISKSLEVRF